jgi:hypothetical protein
MIAKRGSIEPDDRNAPRMDHESRPPATAGRTYRDSETMPKRADAAVDQPQSEPAAPTLWLITTRVDFGHDNYRDTCHRVIAADADAAVLRLTQVTATDVDELTVIDVRPATTDTQTQTH